MKKIKGFTKYFEKIITNEMLFENNVKEIISKIEVSYNHDIQKDFDTNPTKYPNLITWLELHPEIVGKAFMNHIINYGFTDEDIIESLVTEAKSDDNFISLTKYKYLGGIMSKSEMKTGDILYVDSNNPSPDPNKLLLWGYDKNGNDVSGEYKKYYVRVGSLKIPFTPITKMRTANDIKKQRIEAIKDYLKSDKNKH